MQKSGRFILFSATLYLGFSLLANSNAAMAAGFEAVLHCANTIVPALFPYMICSGILVQSGFSSVLSRYLSFIMRPLFNVPGSSALAFVLGCLGGYPIGAVCAADLYSSGECSKNEAERLIAFCNNSGPLFIVSVIGIGIFGDALVGKLLYISHLFSAVLTGIILRSFAKSPLDSPKLLPKSVPHKTEKPLLAIGAVMDSSVFNILKICGFVIFFSVFAKMLPQTRLLPFVHSALEISGGTAQIANSDLELSLKMALISFFIAFSGVSVLLQVAAVTSKAGLSLKPYLLGKLIQGTLSFVITKILVSRQTLTSEVFAKSTAFEAACSPFDAFVSSLFMLLFGLFVLAVLLLFAKSAFDRGQKDFHH